MKSLAHQHDRAEILRRLKRLQPDSARRSGKMSAHQMVCHLSDAFRGVTGQMPVSPATGPLQRTVVKWVALYLPVAWPAGIPTRPEIDQEIGGTKPHDFAIDVARVASLLQLTAQERRTAWPAHPIFGSMSRQAWLRWAYVHTDHHLRQFGA